MRTPSKTPATKPPGAKRQAKTPPAAVPPKGQPPVKSTMDDDVTQDDAPEVALTDIETYEERAADSIETLPELEREIGIADWIDPLTGEPAEGQSPPHLEEE